MTLSFVLDLTNPPNFAKSILNTTSFYKPEILIKYYYLPA